MKRINIFVLLCMMIFVIYTDAVTAAASTYFPEATNGEITLNEQVKLAENKELSNVTIKANVNDDNIVISNGVTLTLDNVTIEAAYSAAILVESGGTLNFNSGTIKFTGSSVNNSYPLIFVRGTMNMKDGTIDQTHKAFAIYLDDDRAAVNISGGTVKASNFNTISGKGTLNITGGTVENTQPYVTVWAFPALTVNISGGTITSQQDALCADGTSVINITGGG